MAGSADAPTQDSYRCACDASASGSGWNGAHCDAPDDTVGTVSYYLGKDQSVFKDCVKQGQDCISKKFQQDLAYYVRTGSFPSASSEELEFLGEDAGEEDCSQVDGVKQCFSSSQIQYMSELFNQPPYNVTMNENTTTIATFRVGGMFVKDSANLVGVNTSEAVSRLMDDKIVEACAASTDCSERWNIESVDHGVPQSSGMPWWVLLLIILAALALLSLCFFCFCMAPEVLDDGSKFVQESDGQVRYLGNSLPRYTHRSGTLDEGEALDPEEEQDVLGQADHDRDSLTQSLIPVKQDRASRVTPV